MLSAAHDIIGQFENKEHRGPVNVTVTQRDCHILSTGTILLADFLPSDCAKFIMPWLPFWVNTRIGTAITLSVTGLLIVEFASARWEAFLGVIITSASKGLGKSTFLAYSSRFNKNVVSTWSSGTGGAGITASVSYATLRSLSLSSRTTMLIMLIVPTVEALMFWGVLRSPQAKEEKAVMEGDEKPLETFKEKCLFVKKLLKYMIPLALVYLFEYFINQTLFELVYFENIFLDHGSQYRWYQAEYQIGVFVARSSVNIHHFKKIWVMAIFQFLNVIYFLFESIYFFTPNIWIIFAIIFWEGLNGGGSYVNTFYRVSYEVPPVHRIYALGMVAQSDSFGASLAGFLCMPVHNAICNLPKVYRN